MIITEALIQRIRTLLNEAIPDGGKIRIFLRLI